jgi:hypothetical protein
MNLGLRLPARYATTTEIAVGKPTHLNNGWEVLHQQGTDVDEMVVRVDVALDPSDPEHRAELARIRDALTAALNPEPARVPVARPNRPAARYVEVLEVLDTPYDWSQLTSAWRTRLAGLVEFTSANHEDVWDCADCGDETPTPVGYRFVEVTREGPEFDWHPTVGVLENGVLRWLCEECAQVVEPASTAQVEQAAKWRAAGVKW